MAYQTLYRKYRPKSFDLVYGQDVIIKTLKNVIKSNKLSHAYLFTGPRGTGKTSSAKLFAKAINCLNNIDGDACNECVNCKSFNENSNPDIIEIDAASNNGVDEIREIKNKANLVPSMSKYKVYIIDEVHMLSIGAFNALLKTLEEPPAYVIFILATTEPQKLPTTIISRCQKFDFKSISHDKMKECLNNIIEAENIDIDQNALEEIINNSTGGMRDAIGLLDQSSSFCNNKITLKDIEELSGNISASEIKNLFKIIIDKNYKELSDKISKFSSMGKDFSLICEKIISYVKLGILYKKKIKFNDTYDLNTSLFNIIDDNELYLIIDFLSETLIKIRNNYQKELTFEVQLIQLMDKISEFLPSKSNVSRETSYKCEIQKKDVNFETSNDNNENLEQIIIKLKDIRINNILKEATKKEIEIISDLWKNINDYLIDDKYKKTAGILSNSKPVAASKAGIIISLPLESTVKRIEKEYDNSKELLKKICNKNYKIVYISDEHWKKIRPDYIKKIKNGNIKFIDESDILIKIKNINNKNSVNEFNELIEMEEI